MQGQNLSKICTIFAKDNLCMKRRFYSKIIVMRGIYVLGICQYIKEEGTPCEI